MIYAKNNVDIFNRGSRKNARRSRVMQCRIRIIDLLYKPHFGENKTNSWEIIQRLD